MSEAALRTPGKEDGENSTSPALLNLSVKSRHSPRCPAWHTAAPSIDMSGVTSVMQTVETACLLIGAIIVLISLVFSVFSFAGGNVMRGITGVAGVLFGGLVIGLGPTWITSLTGQGV